MPPDKELRAELAAVRYKGVTMGGHAAVLMRSKDEIRELLGRSPDKGDAVAHLFVDGLPAPGARNDYAEYQRKMGYTT